MSLLIALLLLVSLVVYFLQTPVFGRAPSGERLQGFSKLDHYRDGQFRNRSFTPQLTGGASYGKVMRRFFFGKKPGNKPPVPLPGIYTDLHQLPPEQDLLVWFGHSSYYLQLSGKRFLVDPVFSGHASPVAFTTRAFPGSDHYKAEDFPPIDYLLITHDHYDHLDYDTVRKLRPKVKQVVTGLGTGGHLQRWGYDTGCITELDWDASLTLENGIELFTTTARHFSGRQFRRNNTLWLSFVLVTPRLRLFLGGDSGYDTHFRAIGEKYGPFDLAILENGQYNEFWSHIHLFPEEGVRAAKELRARRLLPVHWGKFALSLHAWDEPIRRAVAAASDQGQPLIHPMIGEVVDLHQPEPGKRWWEKVG